MTSRDTTAELHSLEFAHRDASLRLPFRCLALSSRRRLLASTFHRSVGMFAQLPLFLNSNSWDTGLLLGTRSVDLLFVPKAELVTLRGCACYLLSHTLAVLLGTWLGLPSAQRCASLKPQVPRNAARQVLTATRASVAGQGSHMFRGLTGGIAAV